ncbi:MAG: hypothetical protein DBX59_02335 [Bacillota bacterium]|nr:MAG: hypothetical protein DBX59_02335 [Bacillota bacterium]
MSKKLKLTAIALSLCMLVSFAWACNPQGELPSGGGNNTEPEVFNEAEMFATPRTLTIYAMDRGYHTDWLETIADNYEKKFNNVTVDVVPRTSIETDEQNTILLGPDANDIDIYFSSIPNFTKYYAEQTGQPWGQYSVLENLTRLYNTKVYGEEITLKEKMSDEVTAAMTLKTGNTESQYSFSWAAGACGLVYNSALFEELNLEVPETTDDLIAIVSTVNNWNAANPTKKVTPFVWSGTYWNYLVNTWWAQYSGMETVRNFYKCTANGNVMTPQLDALLNQQGKLEAYKVLEALLSNSNNSSGGGTLTNKAAQAIFTNPSKRVLMCPEGDWFESETAANGQDGSIYRVMPTPKLSAAVAKYGGSVEAVPNYIFTLASTHGLFIPCYSREKDIAKHFLTYFYSDEAACEFTKATGSFQAFKPQYIRQYVQDNGLQDDMTNFRMSQYEVMSSAELVFSMTRLSPLRYGQAALEEFPLGLQPANAFFEGGGYTADSYYTAENRYYNDNWAQMLKLSGIN